VPRLLRTFVALPCGAVVARRFREVASRLARLDRAFRPPRTDAFHLTIQFLGDTEETAVPALGRALVQAAEGVGAFEVIYPGLGAFPLPARARVVWAGVETPTSPGAIAALARRVGERLAALGFPPEARAFHAHVTLGRLRGLPRPALVEAVEAGRDRPLGGETLSDLKLILSDPEEGRYRYIDLTTVPLLG
jgi:2'-5' RNA ligase